jgi:hypothetical protein
MGSKVSNTVGNPVTVSVGPSGAVVHIENCAVFT